MVNSQGHITAVLQSTSATRAITRAQVAAHAAGHAKTEHTLEMTVPSAAGQSSTASVDLKFQIISDASEQAGAPAVVDMHLSWRPAGGKGGAAHWRPVVSNVAADMAVYVPQLHALLDVLGLPAHVAVVRALLWTCCNELCSSTQGGWGSVFPGTTEMPVACLDWLYTRQFEMACGLPVC